MDVGPGGNLERELTYGNHNSADKHASEAWEKALGDVKAERAIVFPARLAGMMRGLRINPVGVVEEKEDRRVIHHWTLSGARGSKGGATVEGCTVKRGRGRRSRGHGVGDFLHGRCGVGGSTVEPDRGRCIALAQSLASIHFQAMGERAEGEETLLSPKKVTDWPPKQEVLGFDLDTEKMTISLPTRKVKELQEVLEEGPTGKSTAIVREVLVLAGKLHHAAYVIRPGRYFVRRLLQLSKLHLNGQARKGEGVRREGVGRRRELEGC